MKHVMKFNWNQTGMPASLVGRLTQRNEFAEFKSVLNDAGNQVMQPVDAEAMAQELVDADGRKFVEMVRALTAELANTRKELEAANRRGERLSAELARHGIEVAEDGLPPETERAESAASEPSVDANAEWEEWERRFNSLLG